MDRIIRRRKETVLRTESQKRPRVRERAAGDAPMQQVLNFNQNLPRLSRLAVVGQIVRPRDQAVNLAKNARRSDRNDFRLTVRRVEIAHSGEKPRQMQPLKLIRPTLRHPLVQILTRRAKRLIETLGLILKPRTHCFRYFLNQ